MDNHKLPGSSINYASLVKANDEMFEEFSALFSQKLALSNNQSNKNHQEYQKCLKRMDDCDKLSQRLEDECGKKQEKIRNLKEATEQIKREEMKECEELERKATSFKNKFKRGLSEARALEAECLDLDEKRNDIKLQFCMYEPFLKRFGVTKDNLKCKEGKPFDPTGAEGTCNLWDCPEPLNKP